MSLVHLPDLLANALSAGYALGYFESWDLPSLKAVVNAAEELSSPVVIGVNGGILTDSKRVLKPENLEYYGAIGRIAAKQAGVPMALLLNEIGSIELVQAAIDFGFNALMFEAESDNFEQDIARTKKVVEMAHAAGLSVESAVGHLPTADQQGFQRDSDSGTLTSPEQARHFTDQTGVDILGVSIGNVEVLTDGKATMDFELLERIHKATDVPLTLHGGSGIADEHVGQLVARGLSKMNLGAALNQAFLAAMDKAMKSTSEHASPKYRIGSGLKVDVLAAGEIAMTELVKHKMGVYGSIGKANI